MKISRLLLLLLIVSFSCTTDKAKKDFLQYVDPLIGTGPANTIAAEQKPGDHVSYGQTIPAVTAPFGMTQWTPQTNTSEKKCLSPFYVGSLITQGFRATHWTSGSCVQDYGSFTILPTSFEEGVNVLPSQRRTLYMYDTEKISPAYFVTNYTENNIITEITSTKRCGYFRISWLNPVEPTVIFDVNSDEGEGYIHIDIEKQEIVGYNPVHRIYNGMGKPAGFKGYFVAKFDKKIRETGTYAGTNYYKNTTTQTNNEDIGAFVTFDFDAEETLLLKVGTSFTSIENARKNLESEIPHWDFDKTKTELENTWNDILGRIDVEGGKEEDFTKFYTALYHSLIHPRLYSDVNGSYPGFNGDSTIHVADDFEYYCDFSNWDIYRAQLPLLSIVAPKEYENMVKSLIVMAEQGEWLPIFPMWNSYTSAMIGDHSSAVICDAAMKGFQFDLEKAYKYMRKNAYELPENLDEYIDGKGRRALNSYIEFGYIPLEEEVLHAFHKREQVSRTLEYAYDDWAVAQVAKMLGKTDDYNDLAARALNYTNVYDEEKGWVCGRYADGNFTEEFDADEEMFYITEGTPKHYTWYVPHDVNGLIELMGGREIFHNKLNQLIENKEYWHGNEPSHQIPFLFNYVDDWQKTQETVKNILVTEYGTGPGGLSGNDDAGQMSAWYVFGAMGFYPVCPGSNEYQLSSPIFEKVTLKLDTEYYGGKPFVLQGKAEHNYKTYSAVTFNGEEIPPVISHNDFQKGGNLKFINTK